MSKNAAIELRATKVQRGHCGLRINFQKYFFSVFCYSCFSVTVPGNPYPQSWIKILYLYIYIYIYKYINIELFLRCVVGLIWNCNTETSVTRRSASLTFFPTESAFPRNIFVDRNPPVVSLQQKIQARPLHSTRYSCKPTRQTTN